MKVAKPSTKYNAGKYLDQYFLSMYLSDFTPYKYDSHIKSLIVTLNNTHRELEEHNLHKSNQVFFELNLNQSNPSFVLTLEETEALAHELLDLVNNIKEARMASLLYKK